VTVALPISLELTSAVLGWSSAEQITDPQGAGPKVYADLVREKIGRALAHFVDGRDARMGVLTGDPMTLSSEPPIAVIVEFQGEASNTCLRELHRLTWNFSHSPILITLEPNLLRVWTCCEAPTPGRPIQDRLVHALRPDDLATEKPLEHLATRALHWINLVSGEFFAAHAPRFNRDGRADQMLLGNLRDIRERLSKEGLSDDDVCHDLLARIIFIQFLFDRKDADGAAALNGVKLARLHAEGVLHKVYGELASILSDYDDTYRLFKWLNVRFNGDLFPGKGDTAEAREIGWANEQRVVGPQHLTLLADFIRGDLDMPSGQGKLWPQYAFDVIPLEFISSIYETFVTENAARDGIFYTPPHLVDFILDRVLPWDGEEWDLRVLDPACGSGIFLVKAFQRLVHRWKRAHPGQIIEAEVLRRLLERNVFGVDKDPHAVRVACFSLYLAMCDEIEPRHYWSQVVFPSMRDRRLICSDFFVEDRAGFETVSSRGYYDLVIGNAPWGDGLVTPCATKWANAAQPRWTVANNDIGGLFLAKAAQLLKSDGRLAMIQSANSLLFNNIGTATRFREEIFTRHRVSEVYNLSALRFNVFKHKSHTTKTSTSPTCVVIMHPDRPAADDRIAYISPKALKPLVDDFTVVIEPQDRRSLTVNEAVSDPLIWITLMWGRGRDRELVRRLQRFPTLASISETNKVQSSRGIEYGNRKKRVESLARHRLFDQKQFEEQSLLYLDADALPYAGTLCIERPTDFSAFSSPQMIMKRSWRKASSRFEARLVKSSSAEAVVCNQSYVSAHGTAHILEAACMAFNSMVSTYFLQLTSGRVAAYRPEALIGEIRNLPFPDPGSISTEGVRNFEEIDFHVFTAFGLKDAERVLVEDMFNYTLPDFRGDKNRPGSQRTASSDKNAPEPLLNDYCRYFMRVLKAGFGQERAIRATIFRTPADAPLPYRLVAFELCKDEPSDVTIHDVGSVALIERLEHLDHDPGLGRRGIYVRNVARIYDSSTGTPTIFILKPDMARHWTRSTALSDGDDVALDLFHWHQVGFAKDSVQ
jgi:hypothetical protein